MGCATARCRSGAEQRAEKSSPLCHLPKIEMKRSPPHRVFALGCVCVFYYHNYYYYYCLLLWASESAFRKVRSHGHLQLAPIDGPIPCHPQKNNSVHPSRRGEIYKWEHTVGVEFAEVPPPDVHSGSGEPNGEGLIGGPLEESAHLVHREPPIPKSGRISGEVVYDGSSLCLFLDQMGCMLGVVGGSCCYRHACLRCRSAFSRMFRVHIVTHLQ